MNPEIKAKWVAALRSDEYKQGRGMLRQPDNSFCCLGVLCNVHAQEHPEIAKAQPSVGYYMEQKNYPPVIVREWAGLESKNPTVVIAGVFNPVACHNDSGRTFAEIADAIEAQL